MPGPVGALGSAAVIRKGGVWPGAPRHRSTLCDTGAHARPTTNPSPTSTPPCRRSSQAPVKSIEATHTGRRGRLGWQGLEARTGRVAGAQRRRAGRGSSAPDGPTSTCRGPHINPRALPGTCRRCQDRHRMPCRRAPPPEGSVIGGGSAGIRHRRDLGCPRLSRARAVQGPRRPCLRASSGPQGVPVAFAAAFRGCPPAPPDRGCFRPG